MAKLKLDVHLRGELVATLTGGKPGQVRLRYTPEVVSRHPLNVPLLSCSLPVRGGEVDAWAFMNGVLPEGEHRRAMAALANVPAGDVMGLLAHFGRDVAGALIIGDADDRVGEPRVDPYDPETLAEAVDELPDHPLGLFDDSELSIAGLQDKMLLVELGSGQWGRPVHGHPSTHILKRDDARRAGLVRAEHACLLLARAAGLPAAETDLVTFNGTDCLIVRRFDRRLDGASVQRLHQEDTCQALGVDTDLQRNSGKYEQFGGPSLRRIAGLLEAWGADPDGEMWALFDQSVFTVAIGNADAHGKNIAVLHPRPGVIELAPLYDTVPTARWPQLRQRAAMSIGGAVDLPDVTVADLIREATSWHLSASAARTRALDLLDRLRDAATTGVANADAEVLAGVADRARLLIAS